MGKDFNKVKNFIFICNGSDCKDAGSKNLEKVFSGELKKIGIREETKIIKTKCTGRCKEAPVVVVENHWLTHVKEKNVEGIIEEAFLKKRSK
ncbi:MAG: (2Fe-2S) ferredoxin domain-containing protein [Bacteroidota bacterium]|nr:(2Fe-2S) ferredoxin domain-containing protein [Bacteroidota bacterium]